jgi:hypothetical protein
MQVKTRCARCGLVKVGSWEGSKVASRAGAECMANMHGFKASVRPVAPDSKDLEVVAEGCTQCHKRGR